MGHHNPNECASLQVDLEKEMKRRYHKNELQLEKLNQLPTQSGNIPGHRWGGIAQKQS